MRVLDDIRQKAVELTKSVDGFVQEAESRLNKREEELDEKIKEMAVLEEKDKRLHAMKEGLEKERRLLEKEKEASRLKKKGLDLREVNLKKKIEQVNSLMQV